MLLALRRVESRNAIETAHRALQLCGQVFRYAIATGKADSDISQSLKGALLPVNGGHLAAITDPIKVKELLIAIDVYSGGFVVKSALQACAVGICSTRRIKASRMATYRP